MAAIQLRAIEKWFDDVQAIKGINFDINEGEFIVLVGPSGCGKSTLLRVLAGLEEATFGEVIIDGENVTDRLPSERGLSMVFQSYALYPHMTVAENIGFSLKNSGVAREEISTRVEKIAKTLRLEKLIERFPKQLSGGQRQRLAIGRAIIRQPKGFLFDEPLSNLDAALRVNMRLEISQLHKRLGITTVYVTHDQIEAMTLADRIVVLDNGKIMQAGSPRTLYNRPQNKFVAEFIGSPKMNLMPCVVKNGKLILLCPKRQQVELDVQASEISWLGIRPEHITLCKPEKTKLSGEILVAEYLGSDQFVYIDCGFENMLTVRVDPSKDWKTNSKVGLNFDSEALHLFNSDGNRVE